MSCFLVPLGAHQMLHVMHPVVVVYGRQGPLAFVAAGDTAFVRHFWKAARDKRIPPTYRLKLRFQAGRFRAPSRSTTN